MLLSLILMATTVFPNIDVTTLALVGGAVMIVALIAFGAVAVVVARRRGAGATPVQPGPDVPKEQWTMPPIALLERPQQSAGRRAAMIAMEGYLLLAIALLVVKAVQLAGG